MQNINWKLLAFLATLGFLRGYFEESLLGYVGGTAAVEQRNGMPVGFWIGLPLFAPIGTYLFMLLENRLQWPVLRWLVCNFVFAQEAGYAVGALLRGAIDQDFISTMNGLAALGLSITIWLFVQRHPTTEWKK